VDSAVRTASISPFNPQWANTVVRNTFPVAAHPPLQTACPGAGWMMESRTGWLMATAEVHAGVQGEMAIVSLSTGVQDGMSIVEAAAATSMMESGISRLRRGQPDRASG
jgi:hypothetical protein